MLQAEPNPVLEREINLHRQIIHFKEITLHNQRRRLVSEINNIDDQIKDLHDEMRKYDNIANKHELMRALQNHYVKHNK